MWQVFPDCITYIKSKNLFYFLTSGLRQFCLQTSATKANNNTETRAYKHRMTDIQAKSTHQWTFDLSLLNIKIKFMKIAGSPPLLVIRKGSGQ